MSIKETHNLNKYKNAKVHVENLESIYKIIDLSIRGLSIFEVYIPAACALSELRLQKMLITKCLNDQKKIIKNKGKS